MKRLLWIMTVLMLLTAVSCSPVEVEVDNGATELTPLENNSDGLIAAPTNQTNPTLTPPPINNSGSAPEDANGYPAPQIPSPSPFPEGYVVPTAPPLVNPYPEASGSLVWILKPVGEQCAEAPETPDLQTAVADMVAFGIPVTASEMADLPVCAACGCPTSAHFRLQIDSGFLNNAEELGWVAEQ